eukprot:TRINITY_DN18110_c0_g1_i1.p1 TRINITY_DN18110_c0_g1~~TRINITY_DN18110_c0_g1_i1.p1  ORF type:complete len:365 (+),score=54.99 TRINITY_DN18110_c0_g1_i1:51-1145(+)
MSFSYSPGHNAEGQTDGDPRWNLEEPAEIGGDSSWYVDNFYGKEHKNFITYVLNKDGEPEPLVISLRTERTQYYVIIRTIQGPERFIVPKKTIQSGLRKYIFFKGPRIHRILSYIKPEISEITLQKILDPDLPERLKDLDEPKLEKKYKIGLLYAAASQTNEIEMFNNVNGSSEYEEFLDFLGERVELEKFEGFTGGLDVEKNLSGTHSVYTMWQEAEVMFHVSTMLPYFPNDEQQLERKRHIGNDRVLLVFKDGDAPYSPDTVHSKQIHIIGLVQPHIVGGSDGRRFYKFSVASKSSVPPFGPPLKPSPIYEKSEEFRNFLFEKLVNGLIATNYVPEFRPLTMLTYKKKLVELASNHYQKRDD